MARRPTPTLTQVELEFMQVLWARGKATTEDVQNALRRKNRALADGSIRKVLSILMAKGYVSRTRSGRGFVYRAKVHRGHANGRLVTDLLERAFGGSPALMVAALMESGGVCGKDLAQIKQLIAEREGER